MSDFIKRLKIGLEKHSPRRRHLVGVSGGRDSVALFHGLIELGYRNLIVCHFEHGLRGAESKMDARFVGRLAKKNALPCEIGCGKTTAYAREHKLSVETAARALRHEFFAECTKKYGTRRIFMAHHAEDQAETCLFNYLRGAGMAGLSGMKPVSQLAVGRMKLEILRPMLGIFRSYIEEYLEVNHLPYRDDSTNVDLRFSRNQIRHCVMDYLGKALGRDVRKSILRTAEILAAEEDWMREETLRLSVPAELSVNMIRNLPLALQRRLIRRWMLAHGVPEPDYADVTETFRLLEPNAKAAKANLPCGIHIRRRAGVLFLEFPE